MPPALLLILGLLAGYPAIRLATTAKSGQEKPAATNPAPVSPASPGEDCKPKDKAVPPPAWCEPARLLREFFGLPPALEASRDDSLKAVVSAARTANYDLRFMVALVPAPPDPRLDQALDAIQEGFADAKFRSRSASNPSGIPRPDDYLIDRTWLPWASAEAAAAAPFPPAPGVMLFRGTNPDSLAVVFLIPETSKRGIQKDAFLAALDLIDGLKDASLEPRVAILGPSFSGSAESLRLVLLSWRQGRGEGLKFQAASGSATAKGLEEVFAAMDDVPFCRTVLPDAALHEKAFAFLRDEMGWDLRKVALLTEADTAYGQSLLTTESGKEESGGRGRRERLVLIPFPSHISDVRNAVETEEEKKSQKTAALGNPLPTGRSGLSLDLSGREQAPDLVPTFSPLTTQNNDL